MEMVKGRSKEGKESCTNARNGGKKSFVVLKALLVVAGCGGLDVYSSIFQVRNAPLSLWAQALYSNVFHSSRCLRM